MISRRNFLKAGGLATCTAAAAWGTNALNFTTDDIRLEEVSVKLPNLPREFENYLIAFLTDPHLGMWVPNEWIERALKLVFEKKPDLLLLGGDYLWVPDYPSPIAEAFGRNKKFTGLNHDDAPLTIYGALLDLLKPWRAPDGTAAVMGNHDHWVDPGACLKQFGATSCRMLINETVSIKRGKSELLLYGADDFLTGIPILARHLPVDRKNTVSVLLTHNPDYVSSALSAGIFPFDLALCGHTHGGQIKLQGIGALTCHIEDRRFAEGLVQVDAGFSYTSRGLGVVEIPMRINCPAEVTSIRLLKA